MAPAAIPTTNTALPLPPVLTNGTTTDPLDTASFLFLFHVHIFDQPTLCLFDNASTRSYICSSFAAQHKLPVHCTSRLTAIHSSTGFSLQPLDYINNIHLTLPDAPTIFLPCPAIVTRLHSPPEAPFRCLLGNDALPYLEEHFQLRFHFTSCRISLVIDGTTITLPGIKFPGPAPTTTFTTTTSPPPIPIPIQPLDIPPHHASHLRDLLDKYPAVLGKIPFDSPTTPIPCPLDLTFNEEPPRFFHRYKNPVHDIPIINDFIEDLRRQGKVTPEANPHCVSPIFVVRNGAKPRVVTDFTRLNQYVSSADARPLPDVYDILSTVSRQGHVLVLLDLTKSYLQIPVKHREHAKYLCFAAPNGVVYAYNNAPFGLVSSGYFLDATLSYILEPVRQYLARYCDDLTLCCPDIATALSVLEVVFKIFSTYGIVVNPEKSRFLITTPTPLLGLEVSHDTIAIPAARLKAIHDIPSPINARQLREFLGSVTFLRRHCVQLQVTASCLHDLTHKNTPFTWTPQHESAFNDIKAALTTAPALAPVNLDPNAKILVFSDASDRGCGGVILQTRPGATHARVIGYFSRAFRPNEIKLNIYTKELLALILVLKDYYYHILYADITCFIDNQALARTLSHRDNAHITRRISHAFAFLAEFPRIKFSSVIGIRNEVADLISRAHAIPVDTLLASPTVHLDLPAFPTFVTINITSSLLDGLRAAADKDSEYQFIVETLNKDANHPFKRQFTVSDRLLYIKTHPSGPSRIYIPNDDSLRSTVIEQVHANAHSSHPNRHRTHALLAPHVFWNGMSRDVARYLRSCAQCAQAKPSHVSNVIPYPPIPPSTPWSHMIIDEVTGLLPSGPHDEYTSILTLACAFSRAVIFLPISTTHTASQIGHLIAKECILRNLGLIHHITSDRASVYVSKMFHSICAALNIQVSHSTTYNPRPQGIAERVHSMLAAHIRLFTDKQPNWHLLLDSLSFALNSRKHPATDFTPFDLWIGSTPSSPATANLAALPKITDDPAPVSLAERIRIIQEHRQVAHDNITSYNHHRVLQLTPHVTPLQLKPDDLVFVYRDCVIPQSLRQSAGYKKSSYVFHGPFKVLRVFDNHAELDFPAHIRTHNKVNFRHMRKFSPDPTIKPTKPANSTTALDDPDTFYVEAILNHRTPLTAPHFLIKWMYYPKSASSWEPLTSLTLPDGTFNSVLTEYLAAKKLQIKLPEPPATPTLSATTSTSTLPTTATTSTAIATSTTLPLPPPTPSSPSTPTTP